MSSDNDDRFDDDSRRDHDNFRKARSTVGLPATLLIVVGALSLLYAVLQITQRDSVPAKIDQIIATIEADPNLPRDQKDFQIDIWNSAKNGVQHPLTVVFYIVNIVCSVLILIGGIRMLQLSGPALPTIGSVLALTPCIGCCCILGLPFGIWALVALYRPDVRAAMAARKASTQYPDEREMR